MGMYREIDVDGNGKKVKFKASAALPRMYRMKYGRDIFKDLKALVEEVGDKDPEASDIDFKFLETFENIAFMMAKHADPSIPDNVDEWLEGFNTFSIYMVLPQIVELWGMNMQTDAEAKKKFGQLSGK